MKTKPVKSRCRHRRNWIWAFGDDSYVSTPRIAWCYECGAIREGGRWVKPVGTGGENPAFKLSEK